MNLAIQISNFFRYALLHPKMKRAAWVAGCLLTLDLLVFAIIWCPVALRHHRIEKGIDDYKKEVLEAGQAQDTANRYKQLAERMKILESKLKTPITQSQLVEFLGKLASKEDLRVVSQDFDVKNSGSGSQLLQQNLTLEGPYLSLRRFLIDVENLPTLTCVGQARIERSGSEGSRIRANLQLVTYSKPSSGDRR